MPALGRQARNPPGRIAAGFGMAAMLAGSGTGVFPMDNFKPHLCAAIPFFGAQLLAMLLFTVAFCPQWSSKPSRPMVVMSGICVLSCAVFLVCPKDSLIRAIHQGSHFDRPPVWWLAIWEWGVILSSWLWAAAAAAMLWQTGKETQPPMGS